MDPLRSLPVRFSSRDAQASPSKRLSVLRAIHGTDWLPSVALSRRFRNWMTALAVAYFIGETLIHAFLVRTDGRLIDRLLPRTEEFVAHIVAAMIIAALAVYTHWLIARQTRMRDELHRRANECAAVVRAMPGFAVSLSPQVRILGWNAGLERFFRRPEDEVRGKDFLDPFLPACFRDGFARAVHQTLSGGPASALETILPSHDNTGCLITWDFQSLPAMDGKSPGVVAHGRDITAERAARDALRAAGQRHRELFENATSGCAILVPARVGSGFVVRELNLAAERMDGVGRRDILERDARNLFGRTDESALLEMIRRVAETGASECLDVTYQRAESGPTEWREYRAGLLPGGEIMVSYNDVSARRRIEEKRERIAWLLDWERDAGASDTPPAYGDVAASSRVHLIGKTDHESELQRITDELIDLLGTEVAIQEANGDYAVSRLASPWCRHLDDRSRTLCATEDNREATACGHWHCHESRCAGAARTAMTTGQPVDLPCAGGLRVLAVPIWHRADIVGAVTAGYGDPPSDAAALARIAARYRTDVATLRQTAAGTCSRPPFLVELGKQKIFDAARQIGELLERRSAEESLRTTQARFEDLSGRASDWLWETDARGFFVYSSERVTDLLGYESGEILGRTPFEFMPPDESRAQAIAFAEQARRGEPYLGREHMKLHRDGGKRWMVTEAVPLLDDEGRLTGYRGVDRDVTERIQAQNATQRSEEERHVLWESSPQAIALLQSGVPPAAHDRIVQSVNRRFLSWTGWSQDELLGRSFTDLVPAEDRDPVRRYFTEIQLDPESPSVCEHRILSKTGEALWVETSARAVVAGDRRTMVVFLSDIRERRSASAAAAESERRHHLLTEYLPAAAYSAPASDLRARQFIAGRIEKLTGHLPVDFEADAGLFARLLHPEDREVLPVRMAAGMEREEPQVIEYRIIARDGHVRWLRDTLRPVLDETGRLLRTEGIVEDTTGERELVDALRDREREMRTLSDALPILMAYIDGDERHHFANDSYRAMFSAVRRDVIGKRVAEVLSAEAYPQVAPLIQRAHRGESATGTISLSYGFSSPRLLDVTCVPEDEGRTGRGMFVFAIECTDRLKAADAIRERDAQSARIAEIESAMRRTTEERDAIAVKYGFVTENQTEMILRMDSSFRLTFASPSACLTLGIDEQVIVQGDFRDLIHPADRETAGAIIQDMNEPPHTRRAELRLSTGCATRPYDWTFRAVIEPNGHVVEIIACGREMIAIASTPRPLESVQEPDAERESQEEREPDLELEPELQAELQMSREAPAESRVAQEPQVEPAPQCELTPEPELAPEPELTPEPELAPELKRQDPDRTSGAALAAEAKMMRARAAQPIHDLRGQGERVLIAADRPSDLMLATQTLWKNGYRVMGVGSIEKALEYCTQPGESFELVLCDISHRAARWLRFAAQLHEKRPGLAILICGQPGGTREWGTRVGQAVTFLEKPFAAPQLLRAVRAGLNSATQAGESTEHDGGLARPA